jgi:citrate lyase beta subunit
VRINGIATRAGLLDLADVTAGPAPAFVLLPKVESAAEATLYARHLAGVPLIATIESAVGLLRAAEIAAVRGVVALGFGGADLSADLGADLAWEPMLAHRATVVRAAAVAGIAVFDVPHLDIADDQGLVDTTRRARAMGFTGRFAIHPRQVPGIVAAFTPTPAEVARAHAVLGAFAAADGGVCELDGRMIDRPVVEAARRLLARAPAP